MPINAINLNRTLDITLVCGCEIEVEYGYIKRDKTGRNDSLSWSVVGSASLLSMRPFGESILARDEVTLTREDLSDHDESIIENAIYEDINKAINNQIK